MLVNAPYKRRKKHGVFNQGIEPMNCISKKVYLPTVLIDNFSVRNRVFYFNRERFALSIDTRRVE